MPPFLPIETERLVLRQLTPADATTLAAYRSDPDVARYQSWQVPYPEESASRLIADQAHLDGPVAGDWLQIAVAHDDQFIGDVAVRLSEDRSSARIGYTLAPEHQHHGYAAEAVGALVAEIIASGVHRVEASLDSRNIPSARLLESLGFRHEGTAKAGELDSGEWCDIDHYALLRDDHEAWVSRPTSPPLVVRLVEVTSENLWTVYGLATHHSQQRFVATMPQSFAEALVPGSVNGVPVVPWFRAIEADGDLTGFVMLAERTAAHPETFLWRLLVDRRHQRRGIGSAALALVRDRLRAGGHETLLTSWQPGLGGPEPFHRRMGFEPTGELDGEEVVGRMRL